MNLVYCLTLDKREFVSPLPVIQVEQNGYYGAFQIIMVFLLTMQFLIHVDILDIII